MKVFETYRSLPSDVQHSIVVIGNFDGVHRGHQQLLVEAKRQAEDKTKPLVVLTFEPHPRQLFRPDDRAFRITPYSLKMERLKIAGVDYVVSLPFDWEFASQSADDFIQHILIDGLQAAQIVIGYDFKFGQLRKGNAQTIRNFGLNVHVVDEITGASSEGLSSSHVRRLLRKGDIDSANQILGWDWEVRGTIFKGDQRGRELGYPTANMALNETIHPAYGIYACLARLKDETHWRMAACNIGIRPMFEVETAQVETFIFDFDREIYDETLCVQPVKRLRGEAKFETLDDLIVQMDKDCHQAREILKALV